MKVLRNMLMLLALAVTMPACTKAQIGNAVPEAGLTRPTKIVIIGPIGNIAPRDSLTYVLRWGKGTNATGYRVTVTGAATPTGSTSGLPTNLAVTDTTVTFTAINLTFDSLAFNASIVSTRGTRTSAPATKSWSVVKTPGAPGGIQVDSSAIPPSLVQVEPVLIPTSLFIGEVGKACLYYRYSNGVVAMRNQDAVDCSSTYVSKYTLAERTVGASIQSSVDLSCQNWTSSDITVATVVGENCPLADRVGAFVRVASLY